MLRRFQQGQSSRHVARELGVIRKTVDRYRAWAIEQELLEGPLPSLGDLHQLLEGTLNSPRPIADHVDCGAMPRGGRGIAQREYGDRHHL